VATGKPGEEELYGRRKQGGPGSRIQLRKIVSVKRGDRRIVLFKKSRQDDEEVHRTSQSLGGRRGVFAPENNLSYEGKRS